MSLLSFVAAGHTVQLFTYEPMEVPGGITLRDGRDILPEPDPGMAARHPALFSDLFRFVLIAREGGIWVDTDVICLKPFRLPDHGYLFGREDNRFVACGVYAAPPSSALAQYLAGVVAAPPVRPPWLGLRSQAKLTYKHILGKRLDRSDLPWGTFGPRLITHALHRFRLLRHVQPAEVFYPVHWREADVLFGPSEMVEARLGDDTRGIHLWNHLIAARKSDPFPANSYLDTLQRRFL